MSNPQVIVDFTDNHADDTWPRSILRSGIAEYFDPDIHYWPTEPPRLDAALVIDDGGNAGLLAMRWALKLRDRNPDLQVAVFKQLPVALEDAAAMAFAASNADGVAGERRIPAERLRGLLNTEIDQDDDAELTFRMDSPVITFEYQGCR